MQSTIVFATFEPSDPYNLTVSGEVTGRLAFPGTLQGKQGVIAGSIETPGVLYIHDSTTHQATLNFEGTAHRSFLLPDESGILAVSNQPLNTISQVTFEAVTMNWLKFNVVGENADSTVVDGDYVMAVGTTIRTRSGVISEILPP